MLSFRSKVMGRETDNLENFETITQLNIRVGSGSTYQKLPGSPLPERTNVHILQTEQSWSLVDILDPIEGAHGLQGWVNDQYLRRK